MISIKIILSTFLLFLAINIIYSQDNINPYNYSEILKVEKINLNRYHLPTFSNSHYNLSIQDPHSEKVDLTPVLFDINCLATFCRLELKLEKATKMPIKFRLGEVQYVEKMEGKY